MHTGVLDDTVRPEDRLPEDGAPDDLLPEDLDLFDRLAATGDVPPIDDSLTASSGRRAPVENR